MKLLIKYKSTNQVFLLFKVLGPHLSSNKRKSRKDSEKPKMSGFKLDLKPIDSKNSKPIILINNYANKDCSKLPSKFNNESSRRIKLEETSSNNENNNKNLLQNKVDDLSNKDLVNMGSVEYTKNIDLNRSIKSEKKNILSKLEHSIEENESIKDPILINNENISNSKRSRNDTLNEEDDLDDSNLSDMDLQGYSAPKNNIYSSVIPKLTSIPITFSGSTKVENSTLKLNKIETNTVKLTNNINKEEDKQQVETNNVNLTENNNYILSSGLKSNVKIQNKAFSGIKIPNFNPVDKKTLNSGIFNNSASLVKTESIIIEQDSINKNKLGENDGNNIIKKLNMPISLKSNINYIDINSPSLKNSIPNSNRSSKDKNIKIQTTTLNFKKCKF